MRSACYLAASLALAGIGLTLIRQQLAPLVGAYTAVVQTALEREAR